MARSTTNPPIRSDSGTDPRSGSSPSVPYSGGVLPSTGTRTPSGGADLDWSAYGDYTQSITDKMWDMIESADFASTRREWIGNYLSYLMSLQQNQFDVDQNNLEYLRSTAANQVNLMMAAGMSRSAALAALQSGGAAPAATSAGVAPLSAQDKGEMQAVQSGVAVAGAAVSLGTLGLTAGMYGVQKGLMAAQRDALTLQNMDAQYRQDALVLGGKLFGCLQASSIVGVGADGTALPEFPSDVDVNLPNMFAYLRTLADAGVPGCAAFVDSDAYMRLLQNPYGPDIALGVLKRWQTGESPDLTRYLAEYERESKRIDLLQRDANVQQTLAETRTFDAHTDLLQQQKLSEEQTTAILTSDAKYRNQYNQAQINDLRMSAIHHASAASHLDAQTEAQDMQNSLMHATIGLIQEKELNELQLLVDSWKKFRNDPVAWEHAKEEFILNYENAYLVAALQNQAHNADSQFWKDRPRLAANWSILRSFNMPQMLETHWGIGPLKISSMFENNPLGDELNDIPQHHVPNLGPLYVLPEAAY